MDHPHRFLPFLNPIRPGVRFAGRFVLESIDGSEHVELLFRDEQTGSDVGMRVFPAAHASGHRVANDRIKLALMPLENADRKTDLLAEAVFSIIAKNINELSDEALAALFQPEHSHDLAPTAAAQRVDCRIGTVCPNRCIFCTDRYALESPEKPFDELMLRLVELREQGYVHIMLTGLEPTLRPDLPDIIKEAIRLGFDDIQCVTNGIRVRNEAYLKSLLDAGLRTLILSIHSAKAETEDFLSGRVGSFKEKARVLELAPKIFGDRATQARLGRFFRTNSVLTAPGMDQVGPLLEWLDTAQSSLIPFNFPWVQSKETRGNDDHLAILVDYETVRETFLPYLDRLRDTKDPLCLMNLPPCVMPELQISRLRSKAVLVSNTIRATAGETPEMELNRCLMDPDMTYLPLCEGCQMNGECRGVSRGYVTVHGDRGLRTL